MGNGLVAKAFEFSEDLAKRYDACFFLAVNASAYFHVGEIVVVEDDDVLVLYFLGNYFFVDAPVLGVFHGSSQIEVLDVDAHVSCVDFCG